MPDVIESSSSGYLIGLSGNEFDIQEFTELVADASSKLENGQFQEASDLSSRAISMWRGRPFQELDEVDAARAERVRLTELSTVASSTLARALTLQGRVSESIAHLRAIVGENPFNEPMWEELIQAYYLAGRQVDALNAFKQAKQVLGEELGLEPGPRLRQLEEQVLLHDPALLSGAISANNHSARARSKTTLPAFTTPFLGREKSVDRLAKVIKEQRLITVVGVGGLGKTRVSVEAARQTAPGFETGAQFITFESVDDPDLVLQTIAGAISDQEVPTLEALAAWIGNKALLMVFDNCEHLTEAVAAAVVGLLRLCPHLTILATSRVPLDVAGETIWSLPPLDLPEDGASIAKLRRNESVVFFVEAARRVHPDFNLNATHGPSIARICQEMAGIPLALELAASHCDILTPGDLEQLLTEHGGAVSRTDHGRPSRHHSLDNTVAWSLGLLEPEDRRVFERMAVFSGSVDRVAIATICGRVGDGPLAESLRRLAHSSLVTVDVDGELASYGQLPPIKQAARRRVPAEQWDQLRLAHARYFIDIATSTSDHAGSPDERAWFDLLDGLIEEMRAAFEFARGADPNSGLQAAVSLVPYWHARNRVAEGRYHVGSLRAQADLTDDVDVARAIKAEGTLAFAMSELDDAEGLLLEAFEFFTQQESQNEMASTLNNLGAVAVDSGRLDAALDRFQDARTIFENTQHQRGLATTTLNMGIVELQMGNAETARGWFQQALDEFRRLGDRAEEANALERLCHVAHFEGNLEEARTWMNASRRISVELGIPARVGRADWLLAMIAMDADEPDLACELAVRSAGTARALRHHTWWTPQLLDTSAQIAATIGDPNLSMTLLGAASAFRRATGATRPAFAAESFEEFVNSMKEQFGPGFLAALAGGESISVDQALALISEGLGSRRNGTPDPE